MARFNYEQYDGSIPDNEVVFSTGNQYANPSGETETRKQLSTPLYQLKTFINSLFDSNNKIIASNLPSATTSTQGAMSSSDKTKLNGIESGAEVNTIETVKVEGTALVPSNREVNIQASALSTATTSVSGTMSATDKVKLDGIESGAEVNTIQTIKLNNFIVIPDEDRTVTIPNASSNILNPSGLMTPSDKAKLDSITSGAEANVIEAITLNGTAVTPTNKTVNIPTANIVKDGLMTASQVRKLANLPDYSGVMFIVLNNPTYCGACGITDADIGKKFVLEVDQDGNHDPIFVLAEVDV